MKSFAAITLSLMLSASALGQQALFDVNDLTSPQQNPDGTVTFRILAPKAITVEVTGDFLPKKVVNTPQGSQEFDGIASRLLIGHIIFCCRFGIIMVMCNTVLNDFYSFIKSCFSSLSHDHCSSCSGSFQLLMTIIHLYPVAEWGNRLKLVFFTNITQGSLPGKIISYSLLFELFRVVMFFIAEKCTLPS